MVRRFGGQRLNDADWLTRICVQHRGSSTTHIYTKPSTCWFLMMYYYTMTITHYTTTIKGSMAPVSVYEPHAIVRTRKSLAAMLRALSANFEARNDAMIYCFARSNALPPRLKILDKRQRPALRTLDSNHRSVRTSTRINGLYHLRRSERNSTWPQCYLKHLIILADLSGM